MCEILLPLSLIFLDLKVFASTWKRVTQYCWMRSSLNNLRSRPNPSGLSGFFLQILKAGISQFLCPYLVIFLFSHLLVYQTYKGRNLTIPKTMLVVTQTITLLFEKLNICVFFPCSAIMAFSQAPVIFMTEELKYETQSIPSALISSDLTAGFFLRNLYNIKERNGVVLMEGEC